MKQRPQITEPLTNAAKMIQEAEQNGKTLMEASIQKFHNISQTIIMSDLVIIKDNFGLWTWYTMISGPLCGGSLLIFQFSY